MTAGLGLTIRATASLVLLAGIATPSAGARHDGQPPNVQPQAPFQKGLSLPLEVHFDDVALERELDALQPPDAGMLFRVAAPGVQAQFAPARGVLRAAADLSPRAGDPRRSRLT